MDIDVFVLLFFSQQQTLEDHPSSALTIHGISGAAPESLSDSEGMTRMAIEKVSFPLEIVFFQFSMIFRSYFDILVYQRVNVPMNGSGWCKRTKSRSFMSHPNACFTIP